MIMAAATTPDEIAREAELHRFDDDEWDDEPLPLKRSAQLKVTLSTRVDPAVVTALEEVAQDEGIRVSDLVRQILDGYVGPAKKDPTASPTSPELDNISFEANTEWGLIQMNSSPGVDLRPRSRSEGAEESDTQSQWPELMAM